MKRTRKQWYAFLYWRKQAKYLNNYYGELRYSPSDSGLIAYNGIQ